MNRKPVIAIDVDLTLVDTMTPWFKWAMLSEEDIRDAVSINGSFAQYIDEKMGSDFLKELERVAKGHDQEMSLLYWKNPNLYNNLSPLEHAVETIEWLHKHFQLVFVTTCYAEHKKSKETFLRKYFDKSIPIIDTAHKYFVKADVVIDDNSYLLQQLQHNAQRIGNTAPQRVWFTQIAGDYNHMGIARATSESDLSSWNKADVIMTLSALGYSIPSEPVKHTEILFPV